MDRWGIPVAGLLLFCALCAYSAYTEPREIEEDLSARSAIALQAAGIDIPPYGLRFEGQTAILSGPAGSPIVSEEARLRVEAVWGVSEVIVNARDTQAKPVVASAPLTAPQQTTAAPVAPTPSGGSAQQALEAGMSRLLDGKSIRFVPNRDILLQESKPVLNDIAKLIQAAPPTTSVSIAGHTDADGDPQKNIDLSKRRAAAVKRYLVSRGVAANRMQSEGFGASKPIAPNSDPEGKARNRRIEFHAAVAGQ